jgi:hypothetical protein
MTYQVNEGRFELDYTEDLSINTLTLPSEGHGAPLTLVVTRDALRPGEDLKTCLTRQIKELSSNVKGFTELRREGGWIGSGDEKSYPAIVIYTRFKLGGQQFYQAQCISQRPGNKLFIVTLTSPIPFNDTLLARWKNILARFVPA